MLVCTCMVSGVCVAVLVCVNVWGVLTLSHPAAQYCVAVAIQKPLCFSSVLVVNNTMFKGSFLIVNFVGLKPFPATQKTFIPHYTAIIGFIQERVYVWGVC